MSRPRRSRTEIEADADYWISLWLAGHSAVAIAHMVGYSHSVVSRGLRLGARRRYGRDWRRHPDIRAAHLGRTGPRLGSRHIS